MKLRSRSLNKDFIKKCNIYTRYMGFLSVLLVFGYPISMICLHPFFRWTGFELPEWARDDFAFSIFCLMLTPFFSCPGVVLAHIVRHIERKTGKDTKDRLYITLIAGYTLIFIGVCFYALLYVVLAPPPPN